MPNQYETYMAIVGSGAFGYTYVDDFTMTPDDWTLPESAYEGWHVEWTDHEDQTFTLNHSKVVSALHKLVRRDDLRSDWKREYSLLLSGKDHNIDDVIASGVIETAAYGQITYV